MKYLLLLCLGLMACGQNQDAQVPYPNFVYQYNTFGDSKALKRIILIHGVGATAAVWDSGNFEIMRDSLVSDGFQVVTFTYPETTTATFQDGGSEYVARYKAFMTWMLNDLNTKYGVVKELDVLGFSFGGDHALIAASMFSFNKVIGLCPVIDPEITIVFGHLPSESMNAYDLIPEITSTPTLIVTSQDDQILGFQQAQDFATQDKATYETEFNVGGHTINQAIVTDVMNWIK